MKSSTPFQVFMSFVTDTSQNSEANELGQFNINERSKL